MYRCASHDDSLARYCVLDLDSSGRVVSRETVPHTSSRKLAKRCVQEQQSGKRIFLDKRQDAGLVAALDIPNAVDASAFMTNMRIRKADWEKEKLVDIDTTTRKQMHTMDESSFRGRMAEAGYKSRVRVVSNNDFVQKAYGLKHSSGLMSDVCDIVPNTQTWKHAREQVVRNMDELKNDLSVGSDVGTAVERFRGRMAAEGMEVMSAPVARIGYDTMEAIGTSNAVDEHDVFTLNADFKFRGARAVIRHACTATPAPARARPQTRYRSASSSFSASKTTIETHPLTPTAERSLSSLGITNDVITNMAQFVVPTKDASSKPIVLPSDKLEYYVLTKDAFLPGTVILAMDEYAEYKAEYEKAARKRELAEDKNTDEQRVHVDPIMNFVQPYSSRKLLEVLSGSKISNFRGATEVTSPPQLYRALAVILPYALEIVNGVPYVPEGETLRDPVTMTTTTEFFAKDSYAMANARNAMMYMLRLKHSSYGGGVEVSDAPTLKKGTLGHFWWFDRSWLPGDKGVGVENWKQCDTVKAMIKALVGKDGSSCVATMNDIESDTKRPKTSWTNLGHWNESQFLDPPLESNDAAEWSTIVEELKQSGLAMAAYGNVLESYAPKHGAWKYVGVKEASEQNITPGFYFESPNNKWAGINVYPTHSICEQRSKNKVMQRFLAHMHFACEHWNVVAGGEKTVA